MRIKFVQILIELGLLLVLSCHGLKLTRKLSQTQHVDKERSRSEHENNDGDYGSGGKTFPLEDPIELRRKLVGIFKAHQLDFDYLSAMINAPHTFIIFDCERPSYIKPNGQLAILKNHVLNDHLERIKLEQQKHNNSSSSSSSFASSGTTTNAYLCGSGGGGGGDNVWRLNPAFFHESGYIGFDDSQPAEADRNFVTYDDERSIRAYLVNQPAKVTDTILTLAMRALHHPKYTRADPSRPPVVVDIYDEQEKRLPKWFREARRRQMDELYEAITAPSSNFTFEKGSEMKDYLFGNGYSFVLMDCNRPSYMFPKSKRDDDVEKIELASPELKLVFRKVGVCDEQEGVWRRRRASQQQQQQDELSKNRPQQKIDEPPPSQLNYLTYDVKTGGLGYSPSLELIRIMRVKGLCDEYMKFMYHPGYFVSSVRKPVECEGGRSDEQEAARIERIKSVRFPNNNNNNKKSRNRKLSTIEEENE